MFALWENLLKKKKVSLHRLLSHNFVFQDLNKWELNTLTKYLHIRTYAPDEIIFNYNETGTGLYIVQSGYVEISVPTDNTEHFTKIIDMKVGDFFGEVALVDKNNKRSATAVAKSHTTLIGYFQPDQDQLIKSHPAIAAKSLKRLAEILGKRVRETAYKLTQASHDQ